MENISPQPMEVVTSSRTIPTLERGKIPPQDLELEEVVLGGMLIEKRGGDEVIDIIGSNHMGVYYYENIWIIELLMKMLEYSENSNKIRSIFILSILNDLFYFEIEDNKNIDISEFEKEKTKIKEKLYKYSDDFFDELIKKYKNLNN